MNLLELGIALAFGVPAGIGIALFLLAAILRKNVLGKNENTFEHYSKLPVHILDEHECMTFLGPDSGIRWKRLKKHCAGLREEDCKKVFSAVVSHMNFHS